MIIVNLKGGIGNQMFQYALGRALSVKNNDELKLEAEGLERANDIGDIYRPFSLEAFTVVQNIATASEVKKLKYPYGIFSKGFRWVNLHVFKNTHTVFEPSILERKGDIFLDGYWQSPLYFNDIRDTLLSEFQLKEPLSTTVKKYKTLMQSNNSISIHIRRGDYVKNPQVLHEFGICEASYYKRAAKHMVSLVDNPIFFVFSDDIAWVKDNLSLPGEVTFVKDETLSDVEELSLMSMCDHNIIANSTFSWWGAWLNKNNDKIIVAPDPWFETKQHDAHLIPKSWKLLPKH